MPEFGSGWTYSVLIKWDPSPEITTYAAVAFLSKGCDLNLIKIRADNGDAIERLPGIQSRSDNNKRDSYTV